MHDVENEFKLTERWSNDRGRMSPEKWKRENCCVWSKRAINQSDSKKGQDGQNKSEGYECRSEWLEWQRWVLRDDCQFGSSRLRLLCRCRCVIAFEWTEDDDVRGTCLMPNPVWKAMCVVQLEWSLFVTISKDGQELSFSRRTDASVLAGLRGVVSCVSFDDSFRVIKIDNSSDGRTVVWWLQTSYQLTWPSWNMRGLGSPLLSRKTSVTFRLLLSYEDISFTFIPPRQQKVFQHDRCR